MLVLKNESGMLKAFVSIRPCVGGSEVRLPLNGFVCCHTSNSYPWVVEAVHWLYGTRTAMTPVPYVDTKRS